VKRNLAKAERLPPGGLAVIRDGDPGEPEVSLSPLSYLYSHRERRAVARAGARRHVDRHRRGGEGKPDKSK
jgi:hypothetical protein